MNEKRFTLTEIAREINESVARKEILSSAYERAYGFMCARWGAHGWNDIKVMKREVVDSLKAAHMPDCWVNWVEKHLVEEEEWPELEALEIGGYFAILAKFKPLDLAEAETVIRVWETVKKIARGEKYVEGYTSGEGYCPLYNDERFWRDVLKGKGKSDD